MLDRYTMEKLIDAHRAEVVQRATQDKRASALATGRTKIHQGWSLGARLRALASSSIRAPERVARQREA